MSKKDVMRVYDMEGKDYDNIRYGRTLGGKFFSEIELSSTLNRLGPGNVLHIGTATGRVGKYLTGKHVDYVGLELSKEMAKITKERLNGVGLIVRGDAEHLPFRPGTFENVVCVRSFHFFPNPIGFLKEAHQALKTEGTIIISFEKRVPGRHFFERIKALPTPLTKRNYYSNREATRMVESSGFQSSFTANVTKLPLLVYWRMKSDRILRRVHGRLPSTLGTVGLVVGHKIVPDCAKENETGESSGFLSTRGSQSVTR